MTKLTLILIYFFFKNFLKKCFFFYIVYIYFIYIFLLILILCMFTFSFINEKVNLFFGELKNDLYYYNYLEVYKSIFIILIFIFYYVIYLRITIFFINRNYDFYKIFRKVFNFILYCEFEKFLKVFLVIYIFYVMMFLFIKFLFFFSKKHFIKMHYYIFLRFFKVNLFIFLVKKLEKLSLIFFGKYYMFYIVFRYYFFSLFMLLFFMFCIFFLEGNLYFFFKLLPYYSLYMFLLNIYNYIIYTFKIDFDILMMECYYKNIMYLMEINENKKNEYKKLLLFGKSEFRFEDSFYLEPENKNEIEKNFIIIKTNRYTLNNYPNDFYTRILKVKPKFLTKI